MDTYVMSKANDVFQIICEAFNHQHIPMKSHNEFGNINYEYRTRIGRGEYDFSVSVNPRNGGASVEFLKDGRYSPPEDRLSASQQDTRELLQALGILNSMVRQVMEKEEIKRITFVGDITDPKRVRTYKSLAQRMSKEFGGQVHVSSTSGAVIYDVVLGRRPGMSSPTPTPTMSRSGGVEDNLARELDRRQILPSLPGSEPDIRITPSEVHISGNLTVRMARHPLNSKSLIDDVVYDVLKKQVARSNIRSTGVAGIEYVGIVR